MRKTKLPVKAMERVEIAQTHVFSIIACAVKDATKEEIEQYVNRVNPSGVTSHWKVSEETIFAGSGIPHPSPCDSNPNRLHYFLTC